MVVFVSLSLVLKKKKRVKPSYPKPNPQNRRTLLNPINNPSYQPPPPITHPINSPYHPPTPPPPITHPINTTQFIPIATKVNANVGGFVIGFIVPILVVFYIIQLSLNKTVLLRAVFELDREVAGKVVEEAKEEKVDLTLTYPRIHTHTHTLLQTSHTHLHPIITPPAPVATHPHPQTHPLTHFHRILAIKPSTSP